MNDFNQGSGKKEFLAKTLEAAIQLGILFVLIAWCVQIIRPFLIPIVWGIVLAVAIYPGYVRLNVEFDGAWPRMSAVIITVLMLIILIVPSVLLIDTVADGARNLAQRFQEGHLGLPMPPESVKDWPMVYSLWSKVVSNLESSIQSMQPQFRALGKWLLTGAAEASLGVLKFILAIIIAGVLLAHAGGGERIAVAIGRRLAGDRGEEFIALSEATVRSVARGILGVAIIQALFAGIGFLVAGIPGAGLWALVVLFLSVIQIGTLPVMVPAVIYVFSTADPVPAGLFLVWSILVSVMDNVLKPLLLGRGVQVPVLVVFVGAIGGFISSGIIGLFVGAIVLTLGYKVFMTWLQEDAPVEC